MCNALPIQLAKYPASLNCAVIDRMCLSDIKKQVGLIKWFIVRLRHSSCLFHHEDIRSLELAIMRTRINCLLCNYECTERQGQVLRSPFWCHQHSPCLHACFGVYQVALFLWVFLERAGWWETSGIEKWEATLTFVLTSINKESTIRSKI